MDDISIFSTCVASAQMNDALARVDARCFIKEDLDVL